METKFKVVPYFCNTTALERSMNQLHEQGYYPKEIKLNPYRDSVEGFIIYELKGEKHE